MIDFNTLNFGLITSPYDKRDYKFKDAVPLGSMQIPDNYETEKIPFIYNQGTSSECCACAYSSLRFLQEKDQSKIDTAFSPTYTYGNRLPGETFEGMYIRSCLKKARTAGSIIYDELPGFYSTADAIRLVDAKKEEYEKKGSPFRITNFYICSNREQMQTAIMTCKGIMTGITVYSCMYNVGSDGKVWYDPLIDTKGYGGHCILLVGWKTDEDGKLWWKGLNSWGEEYGDHGYFWIPENYPFIDNCYAITDSIIEESFADYKLKYYPAGNIPTTVVTNS